MLLFLTLPIPACIPRHSPRRIATASCCRAWAARREKQQQMGAGELAGSIQQASAENKPSSLTSCSKAAQLTPPPHDPWLTRLVRGHAALLRHVLAALLHAHTHAHTPGHTHTCTHATAIRLPAARGLPLPTMNILNTPRTTCCGLVRQPEG